jgi:uncharacterized protein
VRTTTRAVAWVKEAPFGVEFAEIALAADHLSARGVAISADPVPYRLDYTLQTRSEFVTSRLEAVARGQDWCRMLDLRRDVEGTWTVTADAEGSLDLSPPGGDPNMFAGALDCDLGLSPVTNLMPVHRHALISGGGPVELVTAWVSVPDLSVHADGQRYAFVRAEQDRRVIRYEATDASFAADIVVDQDGIAIDYPGIARRL